MLKILLIPAVLIWFPILFYQIAHRGFIVLLIWLIIGPVASNVIERPTENPFFSFQTNSDIDFFFQKTTSGGGYLSDQPLTISVKDLLRPSRILFVLFLVIFLLDALLKGDRLMPLDRTEIWMAIFSLILFASVLLQSRRLGFGLRIASDAFIVPFLAYYITRRMVTSEDRFRRLVLAMGYTGFYFIICALIERLMHQQLFYRVSGPLGSDNELYIVIMTVFFMMLLPLNRGHGFFGEKMTVLFRGVRWFVLCLAPMVIFITWARSNWLGLLLGIWIILFLGRRLLKFSRKLVLIGLALLLVPVIVFGIQVLMPGEIIEERAANIGTVYNRFGSWILLSQEGIRHPIFGIGLNNSRDILQQGIMLEGFRSLSTAHNGFLAIFAELGVIGLLAYLAILASIVRMGLNLYYRGRHSQDRWRGIGVIAILVAHWAPTLTTTIMYVPSIAHIYVFTCIGAIAGLYSFAPQRVVPVSPNVLMSDRSLLRREHINSL